MAKTCALELRARIFVLELELRKLKAGEEKNLWMLFDHIGLGLLNHSITAVEKSEWSPFYFNQDILDRNK